MADEQLVLYIKENLNSYKKNINSFEDVVFESVASVMNDLMEVSHIPYSNMDLIQEHLFELAWDILRKMTYGCLTLQEYRLLKRCRD